MSNELAFIVTCLLSILSLVFLFASKQVRKLGCDKDRSLETRFGVIELKKFCPLPLYNLILYLGTLFFAYVYGDMNLNMLPILLMILIDIVDDFSKGAWGRKVITHVFLPRGSQLPN